MQEVEKIPEMLTQILNLRTKMDTTIEKLGEKIQKNNKDEAASKPSSLNDSLCVCMCSLGSIPMMCLLCYLRALPIVNEQAVQLMALHDELAEIKSDHTGARTPTPEPLDSNLSNYMLYPWVSTPIKPWQDHPEAEAEACRD